LMDPYNVINPLINEHITIKSSIFMQ